MTSSGDYSGEMSTPERIDDATAEALLAGRMVSEQEPLVWAVRAYRDAGHRSVPEPRDELAALMAAGGPVSAAAQPRAADERNRRGLRATVTRKWRRVRMAVISGLAAAAAKLAGLSTAAKASAGLGIALASVGAAGTTGTLPDPAQDRFDTVVESVTSEQTPQPAGDENSEFGERVSEDAKDGGVDGEEISEEARQQGEQHRPELPTQAPGEAGKPSELPTPGDEASDPAGQRPSPEPTTPDQRPSPTPPAPAR